MLADWTCVYFKTDGSTLLVFGGFFFGRVSNSETGFKLLSICRPNWKLDGSDRSPVQSLEISSNYREDEDMDTYLSDADKEAESSCQSNEKRGESFSTNAIYAVPCKNKKVGFSNVLFPLQCFNMLMQILITSKVFHSLLTLQRFIQFLFHMLPFVAHLHELGLFVDPHRFHIFGY